MGTPCSHPHPKPARAGAGPEELRRRRALASRVSTGPRAGAGIPWRRNARDGGARPRRPLGGRPARMTSALAFLEAAARGGARAGETKVKRAAVTPPSRELPTAQVPKPRRPGSPLRQACQSGTRAWHQAGALFSTNSWSSKNPPSRVRAPRPRASRGPDSPPASPPLSSASPAQRGRVGARAPPSRAGAPVRPVGTVGLCPALAPAVAEAARVLAPAARRGVPGAGCLGAEAGTHRL